VTVVAVITSKKEVLQDCDQGHSILNSLFSKDWDFSRI